MATVLLAVAGQAIGASIGGTVLGVTMAAIGQAAGAAIGQMIDTRLMGGLAPVKNEGPRLDSLDVLTSREGSDLAALDGRAAIAGEIIWAAKLREVAREETEEIGSGKRSQEVTTTSYDYFASFAVSLGQGPFVHMGRVWADGRLADLSALINEGRVRFYRGTETQQPDPAIAAVEGDAPAYRGTAYVVFEDFPLADYGNRIPQIKIECWGRSGTMETLVRGVNIIPGSTEWGYMPTVVRREDRAENGDTVSEQPENGTRHAAVSDWSVSMDMLGAVLPAADTASLVVSWFGSDLRAGSCTIEPRIEERSKVTTPAWSAGGLDRETARTVSRVDGRPAYGSTPADASVVAAIRDLKARGKRVVLYPFVMMDIPAGNGLPGLPAYRFTEWVPFRSAIHPGAPTSLAFFTGDLLDIWVDGVRMEARNYSSFVTTVTTNADGVTGWIRPNIGRNYGVLPEYPPNETAALQKAVVGAEVLARFSRAPGHVFSFQITKISTKFQIGSGRQAVLQFDAAFTGKEYTVDAIPPSGGVVAPGQPPYPWRGRIAPGGESDVAAQVAAFVGTATPANFTVEDGAVTYAGPNEWRFRRFILHLAHLAKAAGGVDAFLIGSEMVGMTTARTGAGAYPFVAALKALAADVRAVLPAAKISYAADWSEYHSHRTGAEVIFHLDPLWSDANIDFVGIDNYLPLSDWRRGRAHRDFNPGLGHVSGYDLGYLKSQVEGGEYWDYYYSDDAARIAQDRTPITDAAHNEPWVFRQKAIRAWHTTPHHNRPAGVRSAQPTAWVPGSKPVWFTEIGCPAVDFGATRPNVFWAESSSESALPWGSEGLRDDFMQRQFLRAALEWWRDNGAGVVSIDNVQVWSWDARPWPEFPKATALWADGGDWRLGHWLNGRAGAAPAAEAIARRLTEAHGMAASGFDVARAYGQADGYPAPGPLGFREWLAPLEVGLGLQSHEADGRVVVESRGALMVAPTITEADMIDGGRGAAPFTAVRGALEDVAAEAVVSFRDGGRDYITAAARATIGAAGPSGVAQAQSPLTLDLDLAQSAAERLLRTAADGRERVSFAVPRSATAIRPGVVAPVAYGGRPARLMVVDRVTDGIARHVEAREWSDASWRLAAPVKAAGMALPVQGAAGVLLRFLDLPLLAGSTAAAWDTLIAAHALPWPSRVVAAHSLNAGSGFGGVVTLPRPARVGLTTADLAPGRPHTWTAGPLALRLYSGALVGKPDADVLDGANALAVRHAGGWEIVQFRDAVLDAESGQPGRYILTGLLRGQRGTDHLAAAPLPAGADVVVLTTALAPLGLSESQAAAARWVRFGPAAAPITDHATRQIVPGRVGQRPFAPAHLTARASGGTVALSWVRRTRLAVPTWPAGGRDPDLAEASEAYRVEIGPAGAPVRVVEVGAPAFAYTAAMRSADGLTAPFRVAVAQLSAPYGPGVPAVLTVME